ncbi:MAG: hypothetical protein A3I44_06330 [Candidatus Sungbacteria bacterium RIFCSPLOWO2_02_FULL_51_17]|nr:MAG: hypothetical protein A3I44_06330 [Candidatus Sungbacteria bacterium RIFCSPLOWO2_02_FULL_51_17]
MQFGKREKQCLKTLRGKTREVADFLLTHETEAIASFEEFCDALADSLNIRFVAFACLGSHRGKEEIRLDLAETNFFQRFSKKAQELLRGIAERGCEAYLTVFLADREPCRTWGWRSTTPEEISYYCREMAEEYRHRIPLNWAVKLWSEVESRANATAFRDALQWAKAHAHPLVIQGETEHIGLFPDILLRREAREHALIQVASYALEGKMLEEMNPHFILLQTEFPARRKDRMYQPLRRHKLPIVHPFDLRRG